MNIKRFVASDMREALREIRAALGADAVMLSSRRLAEGVEVIAAIDYDDSLLATVEPGAAPGRASATPAAGGGEQRSEPIAAASGENFAAQAAPAASIAAEAAPTGRVAAPAASIAAEAARTRRVAAPAGKIAAEAAPAGASEYARIAAGLEAEGAGFEEEAAAPPPAAPPGASYGVATSVAPVASLLPESAAAPVVAAELKGLRRLLEVQLAGLAWNDFNRREPARARVLRQFARLGIDAQVAENLLALAPKAANGRDGWRLPLRLLADRLPLAGRELTDLGGIFAIVGPTGVGKTTTVAKMAARFALRHGVRHLGLVSTDNYRIGAREQLLTFARILGVPMQVAASAAELRKVLDGMREKKLVLIDTAGMSQRDVRLASQLATLRVRGHHVRAVLALSSAAERGCLRETATAFRAARPQALILTKVDEATTLGPVLSLVLQHKLPIAYLSDGQRVPEDLHLAGRRRSWLIQSALRLAHEHPAEQDEAALAEQYAGLGAAAHA